MSDAGRETGPTVPLDAQVANLAARQECVIALEQLVDLGLTASGVRKRVTAGRLHRVHKGVYSLVPRRLLTRNGLFMAAVLACGPGAVLSHESAGLLHGIHRTHQTDIDVTVPGRTTRTHQGIAVHRSTTIAEGDITRVNGIPCTTIARTLLDLAGVLNDDQISFALNETEAKRRLSFRALSGQVSRNARRPAAQRLRIALALYQPGLAPPESELEKRFIELLRANAFPAPERQVTLDLQDGEPPIRADFMWRERKAVIETDGYRFHGTRRAFERDHRRDQRLTRARWRHARITWRQLMDDPQSIIDLVADLLGVSGGQVGGNQA